MSRFREAETSISSVTPMLIHDYGKVYDRRFLYELFHENSDRNGVLLKSQQEFAELADIPYQQISNIIGELVNAGFMSKSGKNRSTRKFIVKYHPEDLDWDAFYDFTIPPRKGK